MKTRKIAPSIALGLLLGLALGAGRVDAARAAPLPFGAQITFGDSLSDVGSYAVGAVAAGGGGKFTINGDATAQHPELNGRNWTEMIAGGGRLASPVCGPDRAVRRSQARPVRSGREPPGLLRLCAGRGAHQ